MVRRLVGRLDAMEDIDAQAAIGSWDRKYRWDFVSRRNRALGPLRHRDAPRLRRVDKAKHAHDEGLCVVM